MSTTSEFDAASAALANCSLALLAGAGTPVVGLAAFGSAERTWGLDAVLARRNPRAPWW